MKVLLTGATGFVGHHVAHALAAQGADLRLLVRKTSNLANLEGIPGDTVVGDLAKPESFVPALEGCDAVVHVAADYRLWIRDPQSMYRANVDGTRELLRMAREAGVRRFVYTSSVATMDFRTDGMVINEDTPVSIDDMVGHYKRSKFLAEQQAIAAAQEGQQVVILNPTTPIGPNDAKPTPTGRIFVDFLNRKFPAYMDTGLNLVDVAEVARTHVAALTKGRPAAATFWAAKISRSSRSSTRCPPSPAFHRRPSKIPFAVAATYAFFEEWITGRIRGKEPRATLEEVRMGRKKMFASSARAQQELGFRIVPVYPAMRAAIEWFRANGYALPWPQPSPARNALMTRTAIIAAMPGELKPLVRGWPHSTRAASSSGRSATKKKSGSPPVPGPASEAATRAFAAIEDGGPIDLVISIGWAGALTSEQFKPGSACNIAGVIDARTGERFNCDAGAGEPGWSPVPGSADEAEKRRLASTYTAGLVDMEAAAIARLAAMRRIPFYCIKGVSDGLDAKLPDFNRFIDARRPVPDRQGLFFLLSSGPGTGPHYPDGRK